MIKSNQPKYHRWSGTGEARIKGRRLTGSRGWKDWEILMMRCTKCSRLGWKSPTANRWKFLTLNVCGCTHGDCHPLSARRCLWPSVFPIHSEVYCIWGYSPSHGTWFMLPNLMQLIATPRSILPTVPCSLGSYWNIFPRFNWIWRAVGDFCFHGSFVSYDEVLYVWERSCPVFYSFYRCVMFSGTHKAF